MTNKSIKAIAVFTENIKGTVKFTEIDNKIKIDVSIIGLKPNHLHGFHKSCRLNLYFVQSS